MYRLKLLALAVTALALLASGCGQGVAPGPTLTRATAGPTTEPNLWASVPQIVDPDNHGWPRAVRGVSGVVELKRKPERIVTLSLGHDEIGLALVPASRIVGTSEFATNPALSNVVELARGIPILPRGPEAIIAARPDLVIVTPYTQAGQIKQLSDAGLIVIITSQAEKPLYFEGDLLLLGYLYGEEGRALEVLQAVRARRERTDRVVATKPRDKRPMVLSLSGYNYTGGSNTTNDSIIAAAGGINAAAVAGIDGWKQMSMEAIAQIGPDYILVPANDLTNPELRNQLLAHPALKGLRALREPGRLLQIPDRYLSTLSFWNVRGIEELARALWPQDFAGMTFPDFDFKR